MKYQKNETCLICQQKNTLVDYLDLGDQPLANSYHKGEHLERYPLQLNVCTNCWHSQLSVSVNPSEMFDNYLYISDTTKTLTEYFEWVTNYILATISVPSKSVLEIACNSGLLLKMFQDRGFSCYGVDPAQNLRKLSLERELDVVVDYWNSSLSEKLKVERGESDLILAFHVLPHVNDPNDFIQACKNILSPEGTIVVQTSQCDMFVNNEFDVVYHEHTSYFTARSIQELAHRNELYVSNIIKTDIHGRSFLIFLQKTKCDEEQLNRLIEEEAKQEMYTIQKYSKFASNAQQIKERLENILKAIREDGYTIIGYGAAAKGNTLLNYIQYRLDYIIDDNSMKWGYLTPGMNIPITSIDLLNTVNTKIAFVPLAWNFYNEIVHRIKLVHNVDHDIFVKYFPFPMVKTKAFPKCSSIEIKTQFPIATTSLDHIFPEGIYHDNVAIPEFISELENYVQHKKLHLLDLGCAGGQFVRELNERGHTAIGIDGSDHCLNVDSDMVKEMGFLPRGHLNWTLGAGSFLFTADITKEYDIFCDDTLMTFDVITSWDVFEHFKPDTVDLAIQQMYKHLKVGGMFIATIALMRSLRTISTELQKIRTPFELNYHESIFPADWWREKLNKYLTEIPYPFEYTNRKYTVASANRGGSLLYAGIKSV